MANDIYCLLVFLSVFSAKFNNNNHNNHHHHNNNKQGVTGVVMGCGWELDLP
jgi:hypothetical protein